MLEERTEWDQEIQCHHRSKSIMNAETSYQVFLLDKYYSGEYMDCLPLNNAWVTKVVAKHIFVIDPTSGTGNTATSPM